jgi:hypothetical protein
MKSVETNRSISELINELVRARLVEDTDDLQAFRDRANEPVITYEALLQELQAHGKLRINN